jgi:hypothetical protein
MTGALLLEIGNLFSCRPQMALNRETASQICLWSQTTTVVALFPNLGRLSETESPFCWKTGYLLLYSEFGDIGAYAVIG